MCKSSGQEDCKSFSSHHWKPCDHCFFHCFVQTGMIFFNGAMSNAVGRIFHPIGLYIISYQIFPLSYNVICIVVLFYTLIFSEWFLHFSSLYHFNIINMIIISWHRFLSCSHMGGWMEGSKSGIINFVCYTLMCLLLYFGPYLFWCCFDWWCLLYSSKKLWFLQLYFIF